MSASLVGSEMCIRDSRGAEKDVGCHGARLAGPEERRAVPARALLHPVSYTHLTLPTICSV
eukprot:136650-Alexandrium_andersonii.AAC.1